MKNKLKELEELQAETINKEKVMLAIYATLAAFSITCLLRLVTLPSDSTLVIIASCFFTVSSMSYLLIVLSIQHVLYKNKDLHIGHIWTYSDSAKHPRILGFVCITIGFLLLLLYISFVTFFVGLVSLALANHHHRKFVEEMSTFSPARDALKDK